MTGKRSRTVGGQMDVERFGRTLGYLYGSVADPEGATRSFLGEVSAWFDCGQALLSVPDPLQPSSVIHHGFGNLDCRRAYRAALEPWRGQRPGADTGVRLSWPLIERRRRYRPREFAEVRIPTDSTPVCCLRFEENWEREPAVLAMFPACGRPPPAALAAETLERLRPHLQQWRWLRTVIAPQQHMFGSVGAILESLQSGVVLLDGGGRIRYATRRAHELIEAHRELRIVDGRLAISGSDLQSRLEARIRIACRPYDEVPAGQESSVRIGVRGEEDTLIIRVVPLDGTGPERCALVWLIDPTFACRVDAEALSDCFALTRAEARVARDLLNGHSVASIASHHGLRESTVRQYVKAILEKTGCARQGELIRLLALSFGR